MPWPKLWSSSTKDEAGLEDGISAQASKKWESTKKTAMEAPGEIEHAIKKAVPSSLDAFKQPETIIAAVVLSTCLLGLRRVYKTYLRRIPQAVDIHPSFLGRKSLFGRVTSVGDGDNFRMYHTPGGRLAGWDWLGRRVPTDKKELKDQTIHVRLAGIDAPELAHFGNPAQPYGQEALDWLTAYVNGRRVRTYVYKADQYSRVVGTVYIWKWFWKRDVSLQMLKAGFATVYEAKSGVEFGRATGEQYRRAEQWARTKRKGMWSGKKGNFESPRDYKIRHGVGTPKDGKKQGNPNFVTRAGDLARRWWSTTNSDRKR
jgi:endonuclease YncB( thermonuclease family)